MDNTNLRATKITQPRVIAKKLAEEKKYSIQEKMEKEKKGTAETEKTHSKTTDLNPTISIIS